MKDILINMQGGNITPSMASNYRVRLSAIYSTNNERIKQLMVTKAEHYKVATAYKNPTISTEIG